MSTFEVFKSLPRQLQGLDTSRNGHDVPYLAFLHPAYRSNYAAIHCKKLVYSGTYDDWSAAAGESGADNVICRMRFHTGRAHDAAGTVVMRAIIGLLPPTPEPGDEPYCVLSFDDGGGAVNSDNIHDGRGSAAPDDGPGDVDWRTIEVVGLDPDTTYEGYITCHDNVNPVSVTVWEHVSRFVDDSDTYIQPYSIAPGIGITTQQHTDLYQIPRELHRRNGAHLAAWGAMRTTEALASSSTTLANIYNDSTSQGSDDPHWEIQANYHALRQATNDEVKCVLAVYAKQATSTTTATPVLRLVNSSGTSIYEIDDDALAATYGWVTTSTIVGTTAVSGVADEQRYYLQYADAAAANATTILAASLYEYEA